MDGEGGQGVDPPPPPRDGWGAQGAWKELKVGGRMGGEGLGGVKGIWGSGGHWRHEGAQRMWGGPQRYGGGGQGI